VRKGPVRAGEEFDGTEQADNADSTGHGFAFAWGYAARRQTRRVDRDLHRGGRGDSHRLERARPQRGNRTPAALHLEGSRTEHHDSFSAASRSFDFARRGTLTGPTGVPAASRFPVTAASLRRAASQAYWRAGPTTFGPTTSGPGHQPSLRFGFAIGWVSLGCS
jgi:hypothetical protein